MLGTRIVTITHNIPTYVGNGLYYYHYHNLYLCLIDVLFITVLSIGNRGNTRIYFLTKMKIIIYFKINDIRLIKLNYIFYTIIKHYNIILNKNFNFLTRFAELQLNPFPKDSTIKVTIFGEIVLFILFSYISIFQFLKSVYQYG